MSVIKELFKYLNKRIFVSILRQVFSIRISPDVWISAYKQGLKISQICEQTLKTAVQKGGNLGTVGSEAGPLGFEPRTIGLGGRRPILARLRALTL